MAGEQHPTSGARGSNPSPQGFPNRSPCSLSAQIAPLPAESATKLQQDQVSPRGKRLLSRMRPPQGGSFGNHRRRALLPRFLGSGTAFPSGGRLQAQHQARSSSCIAPPCRTLPGLGCRAGHRAAAPAQLSFYKPGKIKTGSTRLCSCTPGIAPAAFHAPAGFRWSSRARAAPPEAQGKVLPQNLAARDRSKTFLLPASTGASFILEAFYWDSCREQAWS